MEKKMAAFFLRNMMHPATYKTIVRAAKKSAFDACGAKRIFHLSIEPVQTPQPAQCFYSFTFSV